MSELKVTGELRTILPLQTGTSKAGKEWSKKDFVIETKDQYPKLIAFTLFGDKATLIDKFGIGDELEVFFNLESREYNGKYFHNITAWKIDRLAEAPTASEVYHENTFEQDKGDMNVSDGDEQDPDLPF